MMPSPAATALIGCRVAARAISMSVGMDPVLLSGVANRLSLAEDRGLGLGCAA
jgi:hypothetical protein